MGVVLWFIFYRIELLSATKLLLTLKLGLAIVVRINECYGTIEEDEILDAD